MVLVALGPFLSKHTNNALQIQAGCSQRLRAHPLPAQVFVSVKDQRLHGQRDKKKEGTLHLKHIAHTRTHTLVLQRWEDVPALFRNTQILLYTVCLGGASWHRYFHGGYLNNLENSHTAFWRFLIQCCLCF